MSKYENLWNYIKENSKDEYEIPFEVIKEILGFEIDHSFLSHKKELLEYGYSVYKISMKKKMVYIRKKSEL